MEAASDSEFRTRTNMPRPIVSFSPFNEQLAPRKNCQFSIQAESLSCELWLLNWCHLIGIIGPNNAEDGRSYTTKDTLIHSFFLLIPRTCQKRNDWKVASLNIERIGNNDLIMGGLIGSPLVFCFV